VDAGRDGLVMELASLSGVINALIDGHFLLMIMLFFCL
jgi:hypothetical protein